MGMLNAVTQYAAACAPGKSLLGFPTWYQYLDSEQIKDKNGNVVVHCNPKIEQLGDILPILLAIVEILLRVAGLLAVGYIIYGGFKFITSQGEPDRVKDARSTIVNSFIGLIIAMLSTAVVAFIGRRFM